MDLAKLQQQLQDQHDKLPPVDQWNPAFCGDIDLCIKADGRWFYMGSPIGRLSLVKLFASVLKKESDQYFLVTPVEKIGIQVEDVPFVITQWQQQDALILTTQTDDEFVVGENHPIELRQTQYSSSPLPYVKVRKNLWARLHQNVYYQLLEQCVEQQKDGKTHLMLHSQNYQFSLGWV